MDGDIARLKEICDLAEKYNALVMVDDSHAAGFIGKTGRGSAEYNGVMDRIDILPVRWEKHWEELWEAIQQVKKK